MNVAKFIRSNPKLRKLPFLAVFCTISILKNIGMLKDMEGDTDGVENA